MKIIITGSLGNISGPLAANLVNAGHQVTIVSSDKNKIAQIETLGALAAIGSVEDIAFLTSAFKDADVVYTMIPQQSQSDDYKAFIKHIAENFAAALKAAGIVKVVNLSTIGAHLPEGAGPISGMHFAEEILNKLEGVIIKHLRPASFYYNFYHNIDMIKHGDVLGANYPEDTRLILVHPKDIAEAAAEEITSPFNSTTIRYIASDEKIAGEVTAILGTAIGKPGLKWVEFTDEQSTAGMLQAGHMSKNVAENLTEMGAAIRSGNVWEDYNKHKPVLGKRKLEDFAKEFATKYNG